MAVIARRFFETQEGLEMIQGYHRQGRTISIHLEVTDQSMIDAFNLQDQQQGIIRPKGDSVTFLTDATMRAKPRIRCHPRNTTLRAARLIEIIGSHGYEMNKDYSEQIIDLTEEILVRGLPTEKDPKHNVQDNDLVKLIIE